MSDTYSACVSARERERERERAGAKISVRSASSWHPSSNFCQKRKKTLKPFFFFSLFEIETFLIKAIEAAQLRFILWSPLFLMSVLTINTTAGSPEKV